MEPLSDEEKAQLLKWQTWVKYLIVFGMCLTTLIIVYLHLIAPLFPLLILFDAYWVVCLFGASWVPKKYMRFIEPLRESSFRKMAVNFLPFIIIVVLIHITYWRETSFLWHSWYSMYFK